MELFFCRGGSCNVCEQFNVLVGVVVGFGLFYAQI